MAGASGLAGLVYHEKLIHKAWLDRAFLNGYKPTEQANDLVSEMLINYFEAISLRRPYEEDLFNTAYELAAAVLKDNSSEELLTIYRDLLVEAIAAFLGNSASAGDWQMLLTFSNIISNAFFRAYADIMKKSLRHERAKIFSSELKLAKTIQSHLLPKSIPQIEGFDFAGRLLPAAEVGGDYWSIKHYPHDGIVTMKVADISGHGVAAATLVAAVKFISGGYYRNSKSAADVMNHTNRVLTKETPHDIMISMIYAWLQPQTFDITLVNAGHEPAFICSGTSCAVIAPTGPVLGITETAQYEQTTIKLEKGDVIFFGSDGITEAGIGDRFGIERLKSLVMSNTHMSADELADHVIATVTAYTHGAINDDISVLVTKVTGDPPARS